MTRSLNGGRRYRRTNAELAAIDDAIVEAVQLEAPISLRGVFYRVVSAGVIEKTEQGYGVIQRQLAKLRADHRVRYRDIVDGTRATWRPDTWTSVDEMLENAASSYRRGLWHDQAVDVHVVSEKDAITGVVRPITYEWDVSLHIVRGFSSITFAYGVAFEVAQGIQNGKSVYVYNLGDHDPSGVNSWEKFQDQVNEFVIDEFDEDPEDVTFERLAVTPDQIERFNLPTRPSKQGDTRVAAFVARERAGGRSGESVEVDALPPTELRRVVREAIEQHIDQHALQVTRMAEEQEREGILNLMGRIE